MKIIDSMNEIAFCFENGCFSKDRWDIYIDNVCPNVKSILEADAASYDYFRDILPVINASYASHNKLVKLHQSFCNVTNYLEEKIRRVLQTEIDADIVLYLGLCNGAGCAANINGRSTVLLGIEKIIELNWIDEVSMIALIYHELGHLWHFQERTLETTIETAKDKALWQLYSEGVAMYFEQLLCEDDQFFHQNKNGLLSWCRENEKRLFEEYLYRTQNDKSIQDFFGDWCSFEGRSDVGYFLGVQLVRKAAEHRTLNEVLNLTFENIIETLLLCAE